MSVKSCVNSSYHVSANTISFGERYLESQHFYDIFQDGMALVESTAEYLDGQGRVESRALHQPVSLAYATESMRLTTRLMQISSWLLVRRSVNNGDITSEQARIERRKIKLEVISRPSHVRGFDDLPERLKELIRASFRLSDQIILLDGMLSGIPSAQHRQPSPVDAQVAQLHAAFGPKMAGRA